MFSTSDNGWRTNVTWDLDRLMHTGHSLTVQTGYVDYGQNFYPPCAVTTKTTPGRATDMMTLAGDGALDRLGAAGPGPAGRDGAFASGE